MKGDEIVLLVSHSRTIRAFGSNTGLKEGYKNRYEGTFYSYNTDATPFQLVKDGDEGRFKFIHNR